MICGRIGFCYRNTISILQKYDYDIIDFVFIFMIYYISILQKYDYDSRRQWRPRYINHISILQKYDYDRVKQAFKKAFGEISILQKYDYDMRIFRAMRKDPLFQFYRSTIIIPNSLILTLFEFISILQKYDYDLICGTTLTKRIELGTLTVQCIPQYHCVQRRRCSISPATHAPFPFV